MTTEYNVVAGGGGAASPHSASPLVLLTRSASFIACAAAASSASESRHLGWRTKNLKKKRTSNNSFEIRNNTIVPNIRQIKRVWARPCVCRPRHARQRGRGRAERSRVAIHDNHCGQRAIRGHASWHANRHHQNQRYTLRIVIMGIHNPYQKEYGAL